MGGLITAKDIAFAVENFPPQLAAALIFTVLAFAIAYKIHKLINSALVHDQRRTEEIETLKKRCEILEKQQHKLIQLITAAPCVSKTNGMWLADESRNGGQAPELIKCQWQESKKS